MSIYEKQSPKVGRSCILLSLLGMYLTYSNFPNLLCSRVVCLQTEWTYLVWAKVLWQVSYPDPSYRQQVCRPLYGQVILGHLINFVQGFTDISMRFLCSSEVAGCSKFERNRLLLHRLQLFPFFKLKTWREDFCWCQIQPSMGVDILNIVRHRFKTFLESK